MSCKLCRARLENGEEHPAAAQWRAKWGCDAPTKHGAFRIVCVRCQGVGCERCTYSGEVAFDRCPRAGAIEACAPALGFALTNLDSPRLPAAGGLLDQTSAFVAALAIVEGERGRIREEHRRRSESSELSGLDG